MILGLHVTMEKHYITEKRVAHQSGYWELEYRVRNLILPKKKKKTVMVSIDERAGVKTPWPVRFELRIKFPKEKILAGEPFTLNLKEPHGSISHENLEVRFTPKKNE